MQMSVKLFKIEILRFSECFSDILGAIRTGYSWPTVRGKSFG